MVKHIVMFKLKGTPEEKLLTCEKFKKALLALPDEIPCLLGIEVGINSNIHETWDLVLTAILDNLEDVKTYSDHPKHLEAAAIIKELKEERACVDYFV